MKKSTSGFTIVELLIVIVVIAILAAISIVAFNGIQQRARDTARMTALTNIKKGLAIYHLRNNKFPANNSDVSTWEISTRSGGFINDLKPLMGTVPVDPINSGASRIYYKTFSAGAYGCDPAKGDFYILRFNGFETKSGVDISDMGGCTGSSTGSQGADPQTGNAVFYGFGG